MHLIYKKYNIEISHIPFGGVFLVFIFTSLKEEYALNCGMLSSVCICFPIQGLVFWKNGTFRGVDCDKTMLFEILM